MAEEFLQAAFEIKAVCDEISRRLLRWHWEQKPGKHSLDSLLEHIDRRREESPDYYDRMPDLSGKTSWNQLDTTVCMRVLLDPEKEAAKPLDLLGNTPHPSAARHACNAVRTARNEAAHASDASDAARAAILFNEAVECLEEGYVGLALRTDELEQYYRMADDFMARCGAGEPASQPEAAPTLSPTSTKGKGRAKQGAKAAAPAAKPRASGRGTGENSGNGKNSGTGRKSGSSAARNSSGKNTARNKNGAKRTKQEKTGNPHTVLWVLLTIMVLGLIVRACTMGIFS